MDRVKRVEFGRLSTGEVVESVDLETDGLSITLISFGAALQAVRVPDRDGKISDVSIGYDSLAFYETQPQHFGVSVGRFANRIARGRFSLDGKSYALETNNGPNHLHGGSNGFGMRNWQIEAVGDDPYPFVTFALKSPDGDAGYPGALDVKAHYALSAPGELTLTYEAVTDAPTICNLTNHVYLNLCGADAEADCLDHKLTVAADRYLPVDETSIPTGEWRDVAGTAFDFRQGKKLADGVRDGTDEQIRFGAGFDHCMVLGEASSETPRFAARVEDTRSGRVLNFFTTAPGLQLYSGNFLSGRVPGKGERLMRMGDALCLEPQLFPDSPNQPAFPSSRLDPGETFRQTSIYRFSHD